LRSADEGRSSSDLGAGGARRVDAVGICQYLAVTMADPTTLVAVQVSSEKFDTAATAREAFDLSYPPSRPGVQVVTDLGDAAALLVDEHSAAIAVVKGIAKVFVQVSGVKLVDPKGALTKAATAALSRL
jgi:hypothetical protein